MKKLTLILFSLSLFQCASAQYCGSTDTLPCNTTYVPDSNGLYPRVDSFPPVFNNFLTATTIYFRNYDTILFGTEVLPVYSLKWDTIENLPPGLCWSTNKANNTFATGEAGCIHLRGLPCGPTGQYKLSTLVTVDIGIPVESDGDPGGLGYIVRLQNYGDSIIPVDTTQTDSNPFIAYGELCQNLTPLMINLGPDQTVCAGSIVTFDPVVSGGQPPYTYSWQSFGSTIICASCANASVTVTENSTYILKAIDASGEYGFDTINYSVTGTPYNFQITAPEPSAFCGGGVVTITANANDSVSLQWYNDTNSLTDSSSNTLTVTNLSGAYYLVYTEGIVCQATSNIINLLFYDTPSVSIISQSSDTICVGGAVTLIAHGSATGLSYTWLANDTDFNVAGNYVVATEAGFYQVVATNNIGCSDTSTLVLVVASPNFPPTLSYTQFTSDTLCNNASPIVLSGGQPEGGYYSGTGVLDTVFNPSAASQGLNFVYYNYTDSTGCGNSVYDTIDVLTCTGIQNINAEEAFNLYPNPGLDYVTIQSPLFLQNTVSLTVYDLAGKLLTVGHECHSNDEMRLNINALAPGCYLLQVIVNGRQLTRRFMKM